MKPKQRDSKAIRCAIYTRKSTEEGLEQEFNTLDAQRDSGENFLASQRLEGWICLPDHYDDGGFTGGNMDRPALRRLLKDIEAGKIDCVVVYKVDRLSRSLLDFAKMMETFDKHNVSFVSVTQQFNTATSMGRLILNVLLSFAQFEREMISERTRDKIAATRRKGKYGGGRPVLGYNRDPRGPRLVVNDDEAARVRTIFTLYLELQTVAAVVQEMNRRGWTNKSWTTSKGQRLGGQPFTRITLHYLLKNPIYIGMLRYKEDLYEGEHNSIVDRDVWQRVQAQLATNGRQGNPAIRNKVGGLLRGLLSCSACNTTMMHTFTSKNGRRLYRYYVCSNAKKRGARSCPSRSIPAEELEQFVIQQIRKIGSDEALLAKTIEQAGRQSKNAAVELKAEQRQLQRQFERCNAEMIALASQIVPGNGQVTGQLAELQERIGALERRAAEVREELCALDRHTLDAHEIAQALSEFNPVWSMLTDREKIRIIHLLIERIDYNGATGEMSITFRPSGIKTLSSASDEPENQE